MGAVSSPITINSATSNRTTSNQVLRKKDGQEITLFLVVESRQLQVLKLTGLSQENRFAVAGFDIPGGMVYVGTQLSNSGSYKRIAPCLINPKLRVDKIRSDYAGTEMSYWPSYSDISPGARAAYLEWLMGDRQDPGAYIGYVFLFFYGLEHRVFVDLIALKTDSSAELIQIIHEVERLLELYPDSSSFQEYAVRFVEACKLMCSTDSFADAMPALENTSWQVPLGTQVALGNMVAAGKSYSCRLATVLVHAF